METIKISKKVWEDAGKKKGWLKTAQMPAVGEGELGGEKWRDDLRKHSERVANDLCKSINETVPASVEGMPYARQYVLEEAIRMLEERV